MANILVVDDEQGIRDLLWEILNDEGHNVELVKNADEARVFRNKERPDLVLLDIWMPDTDGLTLLKEWSVSGQLTMPVIMMSGHATIDTAVEATKIGATSFLEKPITLQKLLKAVEHALLKGLLKPQNYLSPDDRSMGSPTRMVGFLNQDVQTSLSATGSQCFDLEKPLREARDEFEKAYFEYHLMKQQGSMTRVAEKTGLERTHLYRKLKQLNVDLSKTKRGG